MRCVKTFAERASIAMINFALKVLDRMALGALTSLRWLPDAVLGWVLQ
jgi:hypothetical protein